MKIIVAVKNVIDYEVEIQINDSGNDIIKSNVPMRMNPYDEVALQEAISLKEQGFASHVLAVTVGSNKCKDMLKTALAMGSDEALLLETTDDIEPLMVAKAMTHVAHESHAELLFFGKQAIDSDANQTGQMTAALMKCGQATSVSQLYLEDDKNYIRAVCDTDVGSETLRLKLPAVITASLRLNQPPFIGLAQIMKARNKPLTIRPLTDLAIHSSQQRLQVLQIREPDMRAPVVMLDDVDALATVIADCVIDNHLYH